MFRVYHEAGVPGVGGADTWLGHLTRPTNETWELKKMHLSGH